MHQPGGRFYDRMSWKESVPAFLEAAQRFEAGRAPEGEIEAVWHGRWSDRRRVQAHRRDRERFVDIKLPSGGIPAPRWLRKRIALDPSYEVSDSDFEMACLEYSIKHPYDWRKRPKMDPSMAESTPEEQSPVEIKRSKTMGRDLEIVSLYENGELSQRGIADKFSISPATVNRILKRMRHETG